MCEEVLCEGSAEVQNVSLSRRGGDSACMQGTVVERDDDDVESTDGEEESLFSVKRRNLSGRIRPALRKGRTDWGTYSACTHRHHTSMYRSTCLI